MKKILSIAVVLFTITLSNGAAFAKTQTPPSFLYLTWESDATAPVAYVGKTPAVKNSVLKFSIQPFIYSAGAYLNAANLNYRWSVNDTIKKEGTGMTTFRFLIPTVLEGPTQNIKVEVLRGLTVLGEKTLEIPIVDPKVVLRPSDNSLLIKNGVLELNNLSEIQIKATPYFFTPADSSQMKISWWIDGQKQTSNSYVLTVSKPAAGSSLIKALVERLDNVFVRGEGQLQIKFLGI